MTERDIEQPSPLWCGNDSPHGPHDAANEFGGRNFCTGRPGTERDEPYKAEAWRMSGYYPDAYARFMASLGVGIDYDEGDFARYEAKFRADLAAHDEAVRQEERERTLREASDDIAARANGPELIAAADKWGGYYSGVRTAMQNEEAALRLRAGAIAARIREQGKEQP